MAFACQRVGSFWECRLDGEADAWNPGSVQSHLIGRGRTLGPGGIGIAVEEAADGTPTLLVRLDTDTNPTADLDTYAAPNSQNRQSWAYLADRVKAIRAKDPATRTVAERDLLAVASLLRDRR